MPISRASAPSAALVVHLALLAGCSASSADAPAPSPPSTPWPSAPAGATPPGDSGAPSPAALDVNGDWRVCDGLTQANPADAYYIDFGGDVLRIVTSNGVLSAYRIDAMGQTTTLFLSGPLNATTRIWNADLYSPHTDADGAAQSKYDDVVRFTFSPDATRLSGTGYNDGRSDTWWGGREDGAFTCGQ